MTRCDTDANGGPKYSYILLSDEQNMQNTHKYSLYLCMHCLHVLLTWHLTRFLTGVIGALKWQTNIENTFLISYGSMVSVSCWTPLRAVCHLHHRVNHASRPLCRGTDFGGACKEVCANSALSMKPLRSIDSISCIAWLNCFWKRSMSCNMLVLSLGNALEPWQNIVCDSLWSLDAGPGHCRPVPWPECSY